MSRKSRRKRGEKRAADHHGSASAVADVSPARADYDATVAKKRRRAPLSTTRSEDRLLTPGKRRRLVATARDQQRNFALLAWAVRKHLDYVSRFSFQARTDDETLNRAIEDKMAWWSDRRRCDVARRHDLPRMVRLLEQCRLVDGDVFLTLLRGGALQPIEGDRVTSTGLKVGPPGLSTLESDRLQHGVLTDATGGPLKYCVTRRDSGVGLVFDKWADARFTLQHAYWSRFDQWRGVTPLSAALNTTQDLYENYEMALVKAKLHSLFGMAITREGGGDFGDFPTRDADTGSAPTADTDRYEVSLQDGPFKLELDQGDDVKLLESHSPSNEFQSFSEQMVRLALLSCDIPYTFFDVKGSTYAGARQDLLQYYESAQVKRSENQALLREVTRWKLSTWTASGFLELPRSMTAADVKFDWLPSGLPWIDPRKEIEAYREAVALGVLSRQRVCRIFGNDFFEIADERKREQDYETRLGLSSQSMAESARAAETEAA